MSKYGYNGTKDKDSFFTSLRGLPQKLHRTRSKPSLSFVPL